jgi:Domain of unknown function (DUF4429)
MGTDVVSEQSQGPGWWLASDSRWYPPQNTAPPPLLSRLPAPVTAKGVTGTLTFDGRMVTIRRVRPMGRLTAGKGEKRIPVSAITGVEWKRPGMGVRGFIRLTVPGGLEQRSRVGKRTQDAARDENSVVFGKAHQAEFEQVRAAIEEALAGR